MTLNRKKDLFRLKIPNETTAFKGASKLEGLVFFIGYPVIMVPSHLWTVGYEKFLKARVSDEPFKHDLKLHGLNNHFVIYETFDQNRAQNYILLMALDPL